MRLARFVGKARAMEMILTGKRVKAKEAYRIGLVNQLVPLRELKAKAQSLAEELAGMPPLGLRLAKEALNRGLDMPLGHAANADLYRFFTLVGTEDRKKAHKAALERKKEKITMQFKGR